MRRVGWSSFPWCQQQIHLAHHSLPPVVPYIGQEGGWGDPGGLPCGHLQGRLPGSPSPVCIPHARQTHFLQKLYSVLALVQVATIEYHRLVGLSNKYLFLTVMEAGNSTSGSQHGWVLGFHKCRKLKCIKTRSPIRIWVYEFYFYLQGGSSLMVSTGNWRWKGSSFQNQLRIRTTGMNFGVKWCSHYKEKYS